MAVGNQLREARLRAGLSREQIADRTKVRLERIEALEADAFHALPRGIYLDGIVRAYAHEVGIDGDEVVRRIRDERRAAAVEITPAAIAEAVAASHRLPSRRGAALAPLVLPVVLLTAIGTGAYLTTRSGSEQPAQGTRASVTTAPATAARAVTPTPTLRTSADATPVGTSGTAPRAGSPASVGEAKPPAPVAIEKPPAPVTVEKPPAPVAVKQPAATPASDLSGNWNLATQIESSSVSAYEGLRLGYRMDLRQQGDRITGVGRKVTENGRAITAAGQTPITVDGRIEGNELALRFVERGERRASEGTFTLRRAENGVWRGRFSSDAAQSAGAVEARR